MGERGREGRHVGSSCRLFDLAQEVNGPIEGPKAVPVILTSHTSKPALLCLAFPYRQKKREQVRVCMREWLALKHRDAFYFLRLGTGYSAALKLVNPSTCIEVGSAKLFQTPSFPPLLPLPWAGRAAGPFHVWPGRKVHSRKGAWAAQEL